MKGATIQIPEPELADPTAGLDGEWIVIVFDNPVNTWEEVINILMSATGCSLDEAVMETWEVDNLGKSLVHHGNQRQCEEVAGVIRTIGIHVEVSRI